MKDDRKQRDQNQTGSTPTEEKRRESGQLGGESQSGQKNKNKNRRENNGSE